MNCRIKLSFVNELTEQGLHLDLFFFGECSFLIAILSYLDYNSKETTKKLQFMTQTRNILFSKIVFNVDAGQSRF